MEEEEEEEQCSWQVSRLFMPSLFTPPCRFGASADHRGFSFLLLAFVCLCEFAPIRFSNGVTIEFFFLSCSDITLKGSSKNAPSRYRCIIDGYPDNSNTHRALSHGGGWPACTYRQRATAFITIATSGSNRTSGSPWRRSCLAPSHRHNWIGVAETRSTVTSSA